MLGKSRSRRTTRLVFSTLFLAALLLCPRAPLHAQQPRPQVSVTGAAVYARAFGDGGAGVAIDALRALPVTLLGTEHAFGLSAWYAKTAIASGDPFGRRRTLAGVGVQWQARAWTLDRRLLFYVSAPLQLRHEQIRSDPGCSGPNRDFCGGGGALTQCCHYQAAVPDSDLGRHPRSTDPAV